MDGPIDETEWPMVRVRWVGAITDATINAFLIQMDRWLARGERFGLLIDSRAAEGLSPEQRSRVIGHMKRQAVLTTKYLNQAVVIDNMIQRTLFYGVNLIFPNPFPSKVFASLPPAEAWLRAQLNLGVEARAP